MGPLSGIYCLQFMCLLFKSCSCHCLLFLSCCAIPVTVAISQKLNQIQAEVIAPEIVINDADSNVRYKLTKRHTQEEIQKVTGAMVITRGKYKPSNAPLDGEKPLYLHISAGAHDQYVNRIMNETGATVLLRGHGSGNSESIPGEEGQQPLHLFLSSSNLKSLERAKLLAENLLDTISAEFSATRFSSSKVYGAVPPPPQLLAEGQSSVDELNANIGPAAGSTASALGSTASTIPSLTVPAVSIVASQGQCHKWIVQILGLGSLKQPQDAIPILQLLMEQVIMVMAAYIPKQHPCNKLL